MRELTHKNLLTALFTLLMFGASASMAASISASAGTGVDPFEFVGESNFGLPTPPTRVAYDDVLVFEPPSNLYRAAVSGYTDIAAGKMGFFAQVTSAPTADEIFGLDGGVIYGGNSIGDVLTFSPSNGEDYEVTLRLSIDGEMDLNGAAGSVNAFLRMRTPDNILRPSQSASYNLNGAVDDVLTVSMILNGAAQVEISAFLDFSIQSYPGAGVVTSLDFDNTAVLDLILPDGVTFVSESHALLSTPSAVPLPPAVALMIPALLGLVFVRRPRKFA